MTTHPSGRPLHVGQPAGRLTKHKRRAAAAVFSSHPLAHEPINLQAAETPIPIPNQVLFHPIHPDQIDGELSIYRLDLATRSSSSFFLMA